MRVYAGKIRAASEQLLNVFDAVFFVPSLRRAASAAYRTEKAGGTVSYPITLDKGLITLWQA
jgi:predicted transcriptional regulator